MPRLHGSRPGGAEIQVGAPSLDRRGQVVSLIQVEQTPRKVCIRGLRGDLDLTQVIKELTSAEVGVVTFTASTGKELSQEADEWGHGAFTLAMIEGLTGVRMFAKQKETPLPADVNGDGVILIDELGVYVMNRVKELTKGAQHPTLQRGDVPSFPVALAK